MNYMQRLLTQKPVILQLLRFMAIGFLNTALDFIILNFISKALGITSGFRLGTINIIGFAAAVVQSYYWNRHWAFNTAQTADVIKNFIRLVVVGGIGVFGFLAAIFGSNMHAGPTYYIFVLVIFVIAELAALVSFGLNSQNPGETSQGQQFFAFVVVSIIGLVINSLIIALVSHYLATHNVLTNQDNLKNAAKVVATGISLIWNFIGYKLIVFKR
jgi:putative flippase GtrA